MQRGQPSRVSSTGPGTSHYGRRVCKRKRSTSLLFSNKMATPYLSFVPSPPPHRKHLQQHQRRSQESQDTWRKRRSNHWQYVSGVSERIRKACEKYNPKVVRTNPLFTVHQGEGSPPQGEAGRCGLPDPLPVW